ncbi:MAG: transporter substrate-binding domain-containing protein [Proteobacteria bacterium]|nr:transporter substrate-binding domain-containing protein [Pseudomonadota bacterium]
MVQRFCVLVLLSLSLIACEKSAPTAPAAFATPATPKVLRVATEGNFPPFSYLDGSGALTGFNVDMAKELCARLQARCDISTIPWDTFIAALQNHDVDMIVASMMPTESRKQYIAFTNPYYRTPLQLIGLKGLDLAVDGNGAVQSDAAKNKRLLVMSGTKAEAYARQTFPDADIQTRELGEDWAVAILKAEADLALEDAPIAAMATQHLTGLATYGKPIATDDAATIAAIAVQKDNLQLVDRLNAALKQIQSDGTFARIADRYALKSLIVP